MKSNASSVEAIESPQVDSMPLITDPTLAPAQLLPKIVRAGSGERLELRGETRHILLDSHDTGGQVAVFHTVIEPGVTVPTHVHTREDELFFVTEGRFSFHVGNDDFEIGPGDFVFAPRRIAHSYRCLSETAGKMFIWVLGAGFEDFFRAQALAEDLTQAQLAEMAAQFGVRVGGDTSDLVPTTAPRVMRALDRAQPQGALFSDITHPEALAAEFICAYGDTVHLLVAETDVEGRYATGVGETPSQSGPPPHIHLRSDELFLILEGRYEFSLGDALVQVGPGDMIFAPRGIPHCFRVISEENGRAVVFAFPGDFESFFRESAALFAQGLAPDALMPQINEIWSRYGLSFVNPGS